MSRPPVLYPLFAEMTSLPQIGEAMQKRLAKACGGKRVWDLVSHLPVAVVHRAPKTHLSTADHGQMVIVEGKVSQHQTPQSRAQPYKIRLQLLSGQLLTLIYFQAKGDYLANTFPFGSIRRISGKLEATEYGFSIVHPDYVADPATPKPIPEEETVYPLSAGITGKQMRFLIGRAMEKVPNLPEWNPNNTIPWRQALVTLHHPVRAADVSSMHPARLRLAFDELLAQQLTLAMRRQCYQRQMGQSYVGTGKMAASIRAALPFALTQGQENALEEIRRDQASPLRMLRLLQGDVGSGKTILALLAATTVLENDSQVALMAPTDLLARQHFVSLAPLAAVVGISIGLMTGSDRKKARQETLERLANGTLQLLIGTHALLEDPVVFNNLGLVIVDEQHRFGVRQRLTLAEKGNAADVLMMTATPIPRTLLLTRAGDMDCTRMTEKPPGRKPVKTSTLPATRMEELQARIGHALERGDSVYWVCPLVEESEALDLAAATERYADLAAKFSGKVSLVHGKMKPAEKQAAVAAFISGETPLLVATTVIEVGMNVPAANIMVIEHAERFGLAQLHQLRGRVGRGDVEGHCILLFYPPLGQIAGERLTLMRETNDGFLLAEEDMRLRGAGDILGTVQSGLPAFRFVDWECHQDLVEPAATMARRILAENPTLTGEQGEALRILLHLTGYEGSMEMLSGG